MKPLSILPAMLAVGLTAGCSPPRPGSPAPLQASRSDTLSVAAVLAQAGYRSTPFQRDGSAIFVRASAGTTAVTLRLDSGAPFDLQLDAALVGTIPGLHPTAVLSGYWTSPGSQGQWGMLDRLTVGDVSLPRQEARIEPSPAVRAQLGATALESRGAVIDYATNTLYLLSSPDTVAAAQPPATKEKPESLRVVLERAGRYRTFLDLMRRAGLMPLLEQTTAGPAADSLVWIGLRVQAEQLSGVGAMPPNSMHLRLTREAVDRWRRGSNRRTAFVPTDAAFARLPADTLRALRADTARLARLLRAHLYLGAAVDTATMRTLIRGAAQLGPEGPAFGFHVLGSRIDVDRLTSWEAGRVVARATIVQPDLKTAHGIAVAHGIDRVLGPLGTAASPLGPALARQGYVGVPLYRREDGNGYTVHATVNGIPVALTLDTGTPADLVLDRHWAERQLPAGRSYPVAFDSVKLGAVEVQTADLSASAQWTAQLGFRPDGGTVGSPLLARYGAVVDYAAGMLYLRRPGAATPATP